MSLSDAGASSIAVAIRVRPFTIREAAQIQRCEDSTLFLGGGSLAAAPPKLNQRGLRSVIKVVDDRCLVFDPPEDNPVHKFSRSVVPTMGKKVKDQVFAFDRIFDENATQTEVYEGTTKPLLDNVLDGYNATVFAYGATGCGKTHTITGTSQDPGIIFLTMQELFEKIQERSLDKTSEVSLSYLEIYNETIRDLLVPSNSKQGLMLREDSHQTVTVAGLSSCHPKNVQEVMDLIVQGNEYRTVSPTEANATSSRSHAVLQINIALKDRNADINEPHTIATLSIIDLAGSERASATKNRGERLIEGANINKSLLALGSCINALCDPRIRNHVPYRNSKLTRLLKFSLGGNCKTVMVVCISPSSAHFDETQNTLRYANRAKNIQTKVTRNVFNVNRHVKDFLVKIDEQMALINELKGQQREAEHLSFQKFRKQLEKREATAREGIQRLRAAYENSLGERQEKMSTMKKLHAVERRVSLLQTWITAFDAVTETRGDEEYMPASLVAMKKSAQGILVELEHSRHHLRQKLDKANWERAIDTALQHGIRQLQDGDGVDYGETATLTREAELLRNSFAREAYHDVLESDKTGDVAAVHALLKAQFEVVASLADTLVMNEEEAVTHAKGIIGRLLEVGYSAASQVIKSDGSLVPTIEAFPPSKRGTPKKRRSAIQQHHYPVPSMATLKPVQLTATGNTPVINPVNQQTTPIRASPRRAKLAQVRKGITFTPVKRRTPLKRAVRWRDDDGEEGTLADFEKTPNKVNPVEPTTHTTDPLPTVLSPPVLEHFQPAVSNESDSSPSIIVPEPSSQYLQEAKPINSRFQVGFLSTSARPAKSSPSSDHLAARLKARAGLLSSSDAEADEKSPLRNLSLGRTLNQSPTASLSDAESSINLQRPSIRSPSLVSNENRPPPASKRTNGVLSYLDLESPTVDSLKLRSAIQLARKSYHHHHPPSLDYRRASSAAGSTASVTRRHGTVGGERFSSFGLGSTRSVTNGVSRRRGSTERRKSPPLSCSPPEWRDRSLTPSQARRMNLTGSRHRDERSPPVLNGEHTRRITLGGSAAGMSRSRQGLR